MKALCLAVCLLLCSASAASASDGEARRKTAFGTELDFLPFILQGFYGSLWAGYSHLKFRAVVAGAVTPGFFIDDKFKDNRLLVVAGIADYYFQSGFKGWWIGAGGEHWAAAIKEKRSGTRAEYENWILTLGGGYSWFLWKGLYVNPWAAFHLRVAGDDSVEAGSSEFKPALFTPEGSIKIGYKL
jgi:hypothetical protein